MKAKTRSLIQTAMKTPFLEREEEHLLAVRWKEHGDQVALHRLTNAHTRLVITIASRFRNYGLPADDLFQEGYVGLLQAAARFEPERDVRFSTYATWWIRASIQDYILRNWSIVRGGTSSTQKALFFNLRRLRARLTQLAGGRVDTDIHGTIATAIGVSRTDVAVMDARLSGSDMSLNAPLQDGDDNAMERQDFLVDATPGPDEMVETALDSEKRVSWVKAALKVLNERELWILKARRLEDDQATLESLGEKLGISKERVRQIETRALEKLKAALIAKHGPNAQAVLV
jgi:RNA polymerase sigma-32 factor